MFFLHLSPLTRGFWSSMAEIGLLTCFLLWIVSNYNVWGHLYIYYDDKLESLKYSMTNSEWISLQYRKVGSLEKNSKGEKSEAFEEFSENLERRVQNCEA